MNARTDAGAFAPGLALALAVSLAAVAAEALLTRATGLRIPAIVIALLIGMGLFLVAENRAFTPGLAFAIKKLLRYAIALLGLRIAVSDIVGLGWATAAVVVVSMAATIVSGIWIARAFGRSDAYGALASGATAVCGASAALAIATVLPASRERDADTAFVVLACNALATVAMLAYPLVAAALHFSETRAGILLGATIHDVAQVVGAGYAVSDPSGNIAVIVKLFRVFLLLPVVLAIGWYFAKAGGGTAEARVPVPVFAVVFLILALLNSLLSASPALAGVYAPVKAALGEVSRWGLLIAISALGLGTSAKAILRIGWRHIAVVCLSTLVILFIVLAGQLIQG